MKQMWFYTQNTRMNVDVVVLLVTGYFVFYLAGLLLVARGSLLGLIFYGPAFYLLYMYYRIRKTPYIRTIEEGITIYRYLQHKREYIKWEDVQEILFENGRVKIVLSGKEVKINLSLVDEEDRKD